ncbi:MAG: ATP-dependent helicase HrpB, partial [Pseudomonadota bacterium]|nr:ATP-dependent helicase HrpB [Pseudomonadota bacterium]
PLAPTPGPSLAGRGAAAALPLAVALAFPDRIARRRDSSGEHYASVGGRGFRLDPESPLATSEWLAVAEVAGAAAGARIMSAAAITLAEVEALFATRITPFSEVRFDPATSAIVARKGRRLGAIRLSSAPDPSPSAAAVAQGLLEAVRRGGLALLSWPDSAVALRARAAFARAYDPIIADLGDEALLASLDTWLLPLLTDKRRLDLIAPDALRDALHSILGWDAARALDKLAPAVFASPAGTSHPIDYSAPGGPTVELRPQAIYGLAVHPTVAGGEVALILSLTSPAHRPIQTTRDLPAFWAGSWREVAKEMRGRYPRHHWPDEPALAVASLKTKRAQERST